MKGLTRKRKLFAFLDGISRTLDIGGGRHLRFRVYTNRSSSTEMYSSVGVYSRDGQESDRRALAADWKAVGKEINRAIENV